MTAITRRTLRSSGLLTVTGTSATARIPQCITRIGASQRTYPHRQIMTATARPTSRFTVQEPGTSSTARTDRSNIGSSERALTFRSPRLNSGRPRGGLPLFKPASRQTAPFFPDEVSGRLAVDIHFYRSPLPLIESHDAKNAARDMAHEYGEP